VGTLAGAAAGGLGALLLTLAVSPWVRDEDALEGLLVLSLCAAAVLGGFAGCALRLRAARQPGIARTLVLAVPGVGLAVLALRLVGAAAPQELINRFGVLLVPAIPALVLAVTVAAARLLALRGAAGRLSAARARSGPADPAA